MTWIHVRYVHSTHLYLHLQIVTWSMVTERREFGTCSNSSERPCSWTRRCEPDWQLHKVLSLLASRRSSRPGPEGGTAGAVRWCDPSTPEGRLCTQHERTRAAQGPRPFVSTCYQRHFQAVCFRAWGRAFPQKPQSVARILEKEMISVSTVCPTPHTSASKGAMFFPATL